MNIFHFHLMPWPYLPEDYHGPSWIRVDGDLFDAGLAKELYNRYLDELVYCEELGFDGVCINEHHQNAYGLMGSPNVLAGALARQTERMSIAVCGNAVTLYNPPQRVAEEYALLDNISRGRLIAGLVIGGGPEYVSFGINPTEARGRFREAVDLILQCWTRPGPFEFHGDYYDYSYVNTWPRPVQKPHPEVWIPGTGSKETIEYIAERRYSYMGIPYFRFAAFKRNFDAFRAAAERFGYQAHPMQMGMLLPVYVSDTDASARREYEPHISYFRAKLSEGVGRLPPGYTSASSLAMSLLHSGDVMRAAKDWEELTSEFIVVGSVDTVRQRLSDLAGELGFGTLLTLLQMGSLPADLTRRNQELFAGEVMPYLKQQFPALSDKPAMESKLDPVDRARASFRTDNPLTAQRRGAGPDLVWLGSGFNEAPWTKVSGALADSYRVLNVAYPTLASGGLDRLRTVDDFTFNLVRLLDTEGIDRAIFVGSSLGGWLAADFATRYPERVASLVLIAPAGLRHPDARGEDVFYVSLVELPALLMHDPASADLGSVPALDPATNPQEAMVALSEGLEIMARFGWSPYLNDPRLRERLPRYGGGALVLWGSEDGVLPAAHADLWVDYLGAELHLVEGAGHLAALENPSSVLAAVEGWLAKDVPTVAEVAR